ncbi:unnamed protein product [Ectocarpus sp. 4 AP-2014]
MPDSQPRGPLGRSVDSSHSQKIDFRVFLMTRGSTRNSKRISSPNMCGGSPLVHNTGVARGGRVCDVHPQQRRFERPSSNGVRQKGCSPGGSIRQTQQRELVDLDRAILMKGPR